MKLSRKWIYIMYIVIAVIVILSMVLAFIPGLR